MVQARLVVKHCPAMQLEEYERLPSLMIGASMHSPIKYLRSTSCMRDLWGNKHAMNRPSMV